MKAWNMNTHPTESDVPMNTEPEHPRRYMLLILPPIYLALLVATLLDAVYGNSLIAPWSLALVCSGTVALLGCSRLFSIITTIDSWLWQLARCSALAGLCSAIVGLGILFLGDGSFHTMTTGLSLATFSILYGILIAMPAGCAVVLRPGN